MTTNERANSPNPANAHQEKKMDMKSKLSTLWIFVALNYLYCDIVSLMDPELLPLYLRGNVNGLELTPGFLLGAAILVEIFIAWFSSPECCRTGRIAGQTLRPVQ
jgi:hypothetical protein